MKNFILNLQHKKNSTEEVLKECQEMLKNGAEEYEVELHALYTDMVKEILMTIKEKDIELEDVADFLDFSEEELMEYLEFRKEDYATYHLLLKYVTCYGK